MRAREKCSKQEWAINLSEVPLKPRLVHIKDPILGSDNLVKYFDKKNGGLEIERGLEGKSRSRLGLFFAKAAPLHDSKMLVQLLRPMIC